MVWHLYNKEYDFEDYMQHHPGGKTILENTKGEKDITALFETYHAFSNKEFFKRRLQAFEIESKEDDNNANDKNKTTNFDFTSYNELAERVKTIFPNRASIKAPYSWYFQNGTMVLLYMYTFYHAMISRNSNIINKCFFSQIAGLAYISLGFNIFHDGSHYAISIIPEINESLAKLWASWGGWNATIWFYHHVLNHHSYTGLENLDPDLYHLSPFASKTGNFRKKPLLLNSSEYIPFITFGIPGYYVGQMVAYIYGAFQYKIFRILLPKNREYYDLIDIILIVLKIYALTNGGILPTINYIMALNFWYFINIAFDHDTYENIVENHYSGTDWLKIQISHSGNFLNDNHWWTRIFGAINYQIEHHLFPNMSNVHYPTIAPIVREFCKEKNIQYVHHTTLIGAFRSYMKMLKYRNSDNLQKDK